MIGRRVWLSLSVLATLATAAATIPRWLDADQFPHEKHAHLFPACAACHAGVEQSDSARFYPPVAICAGCHDGVVQDRVAYEPRRPGGPTLLVFDHQAHERTADDGPTCEGCHTRTGETRMAVEPAAATRCLECHAHEAPAHIVTADCAQCHRPFAESGLEPALALALPLPPDHEDPDFLSAVHGDSAGARPQRCATCHVRERCLACHVDSGQPVVAGMPGLGEMGLPVALPPTGAAQYPAPASHRDPQWIAQHGAVARAGTAQCATCHTRQSCESCHRGGPVQATIASLPDAGTTSAPGVGTRRVAPVSHSTPQFRIRHGELATTSPATCTTCHVRVECEACHNAPDRAPFHPANFESRHASASYARELECSSCHSAERFCRDCHAQLGMRSSGRLGSGFHDAEPLWLLRHGQAARQTLESCTTCHAQRDCMQCHSETGSFQVSPHGPGFEPERARDRNARMCAACHLGDPLGDT